MDCAGKLCEDWGDLGCFGHTLQLCLKPAMELTAVSKVISRCRKLVGHFKHSTTLTAEMRERQKAMGVPEHTLVQDVVTRWNSTYQMMTRLVEQRRVVSDILLDPKLSKKEDSVLNLKEYEWDLIGELSDILRPLADTTEYMCTERCVSVSEIYPIVCGLVNRRLVTSNTDSNTASRVKEVIREDLMRRYQPSSDTAAESAAALGALLDPRYKKLPFFSSQQRKITHGALESCREDLPLRLPASDVNNCEETPAKRRKLDFLDFGSPERTSEDEVQSYLSEKMVSGTDPLLWWRDNEERFPKIAIVAKRVLAVPATSVPSERIFSATGLLINKLRNRLSSEIVDSIFFLNKNEVNITEAD
ncbi:E3 SUMO-protein ligase ZBED1-like [Mercenaria mercenaria]|uniref:E3 SUMO-protein ligase ZBED1-like n=1 Tax=Mercenaria mercenaria TaxID=6596 RepID=UPI00234E72AB|nr:E3 SUMO-protein ligase ZBED1-like [Mercenaria mercenaria]